MTNETKTVGSFKPVSQLTRFENIIKNLEEISSNTIRFSENVQAFLENGDYKPEDKERVRSFVKEFVGRAYSDTIDVRIPLLGLKHFGYLDNSMIEHIEKKRKRRGFISL